MIRKDKKKVIGEELSDQRLQQLLAIETEQGVNPDYFILSRAYRALRSDDFARFLPFFLQTGRDLQAIGPDGLSLAEEIRSHQQGQPYLKALEQAEQK